MLPLSKMVLQTTAQLQSVLARDDERDIFVGCETAIVNDAPEYIGSGLSLIHI